MESRLSADCHCVDFDPRALRERLDLDCGSGRIGRREVFRVLLVHLRKLSEVDHEDIRFHDILHAETRGAEHRLEVLKDSFSLIDYPLLQAPCRGVETELSGAVDRSSVNGLRIRSHRGRSARSSHFAVQRRPALIVSLNRF